MEEASNARAIGELCEDECPEPRIPAEPAHPCLGSCPSGDLLRKTARNQAKQQGEYGGSFSHRAPPSVGFRQKFRTAGASPFPLFSEETGNPDQIDQLRPATRGALGTHSACIGGATSTVGVGGGSSHGLLAAWPAAT